MALTQPDSTAQLTASQVRALNLGVKFQWLGVVNAIGAFITSFWLLYLVFSARGALAVIVVFFLLSVCYKFGAALMFSVASLTLYFYVHAVGLWLPIVACVAAAVSLGVAVYIAKATDLLDS